MNCHRCHGLMVQDRAYDLLDAAVHCDVWRCLSCGNLIDSQILLNQNIQLPTRELNEGKWPIRVPAAA